MRKAQKSQSEMSVRADEATISIHANVIWRATQSKRSAVWVADCEDLGLVVEADSLDALYSSIMENMELLFSDLLEEDDLDEFLGEKGWQYSGNAKAPEPHFYIPWHLMTVGRSDPIPVCA